MATVAEREFRHEAVFYRDLEGFLSGTLPFIEGALGAGEPIMVAVGRGKTQALREGLGDRASRVAFVEMESLGLNPGRIISAWRDFVEQNPGRSLRGIGEPAWPGRDGEELIECDHHESLLNLALSQFDLWLLCPYDASRLDPEILDAARRNHPYLSGSEGNHESPGYTSPERLPNPLHVPLAAAPERATELTFKGEHLGDIRHYVGERARLAGIGGARGADLALAVHELATNSVYHGGGGGTIAIWNDSEYLYCEVRDRGHITDPLVGRLRAAPSTRGGRGVWLVHHLCDLVQVRSLPEGNAVRIRMALDLTES
jgi:anti-sigma regulatory factor (Ser/Thr protein kinase)